MSPNVLVLQGVRVDVACLIFILKFKNESEEQSVSGCCLITSLKDACFVKNLRNLNEFLDLILLSSQESTKEAWSNPVLGKWSTSKWRKIFCISKLNKILTNLSKLQSLSCLPFHQVKGLSLKCTCARSHDSILWYLVILLATIRPRN